MTKSDFIEHIKDVGVTITFQSIFLPGFDDEPLSSTIQEIPNASQMFKGDQTFACKPIYKSEFGTSFSFLLNLRKKYHIKTDNDFEDFAQALVGDVLCITNKKGKVSYLWFHDDERQSFEILETLPETKKFSIDHWITAGIYETRRSFIDKQEVFVKK